MQAAHNDITLIICPVKGRKEVYNRDRDPIVTRYVSCYVTGATLRTYYVLDPRPRVLRDYRPRPRETFRGVLLSIKIIGLDVAM